MLYLARLHAGCLDCHKKHSLKNFSIHDISINMDLIHFTDNLRFVLGWAVIAYYIHKKVEESVLKHKEENGSSDGVEGEDGIQLVEMQRW